MSIGLTRDGYQRDWTTAGDYEARDWVWLDRAQAAVDAAEAETEAVLERWKKAFDDRGRQLDVAERERDELRAMVDCLTLEVGALREELSTRQLQLGIAEEESNELRNICRILALKGQQ